MGRGNVRLQFARSPRLPGYYLRALLSRSQPCLPTGTTIPRLDGEVAEVRIDLRHLSRYRAVCGFAADGLLPITYPHVLATPVQVALMTHPEFLVRLMGLVHIANEISLHRPLSEQASYRLRCWIEGHRDTDRGQEFDLHTELLDRDGAAWSGRSTLLARHVVGGEQAARTARAALRAPKPAAGQPVTLVPFAADHRSAREYARSSGDVNPIHLADFMARWFGFDQAVAHGMWSMARSLAALGPELNGTPCRVPVEFKLPLFLPSEVRLEHWRDGLQRLFVLRNVENRRPHLAGSVEKD
jgi:acyl dehydratase